jgi:hypothetical protein
MPNEKRTTIAGYQDELVFLHALTNLPLTNVMKNTYLHNGVLLAFPPRFCCLVANRTFQNYKLKIKRGSRSTDKRIVVLLFEFAPVFEQLWDNIYVDMLAEQLGAYKMSCNKEKTPQKGTSPFCDSAIVEEEEQEDEFYDDVTYDNSVYNKGAVVSPLMVIHEAPSCCCYCCCLLSFNACAAL